MIKVKFNGTNAFIDVAFQRTSSHVVTLMGIVPAAETGFTTYRLGGEQLGDFSDYSTVYRILPYGCQYSNDGSVWHEPEPVPPMPTPEPTPVLVTDEIGNTYRQEIGTDGKIRLVMVESYTGELFE